jgi:hypothetical protein
MNLGIILSDYPSKLRLELQEITKNRKIELKRKFKKKLKRKLNSLEPKEDLNGI